ncbi:9978_t:CDS:2, partial [Diversispora eburnea]
NNNLIDNTITTLLCGQKDNQVIYILTNQSPPTGINLSILNITTSPPSINSLNSLPIDNFENNSNWWGTSAIWRNLENSKYRSMSEINMYNLVNNTWTYQNVTGQIPSGRDSFSLSPTRDGKLILYGGINKLNSNPISSDISILDTTTTPFTWSTPDIKNPIPSRYSHTANIIGNNLIGSSVHSNSIPRYSHDSKVSNDRNNNKNSFFKKTFTWSKKNNDNKDNRINSYNSSSNSHYSKVKHEENREKVITKELKEEQESGSSIEETDSIIEERKGNEYQKISDTGKRSALDFSQLRSVRKDFKNLLNIKRDKSESAPSTASLMIQRVISVY